jgi:6-phosphofructokinase 1
VPERSFSTAHFIDDVKRTMDKHRRCVVAVSEGVTTEDGTSLVESIVGPDKVERDAHGNVKLSGSDLNRAFETALAQGLPGKRARVDALGYMPRGYIGSINETDAREAHEAGQYAVQVADEGGGSVALKYEDGKIVMRKVPLSAVAARTRHMPADFLTSEGTRLAQPGIDYLKRLIPRKYEVGKPFV